MSFLSTPDPGNYQSMKQAPGFGTTLPPFDADLVTIPFKYRPAQPCVVPQLTTTANAAIYIGMRYDQGYQRNVFYHHQQRSEIRSFSLGAGGY